MNTELKQLLDLLKRVNSVEAGVKVVDGHFEKNVVWSLLKQEWDQMTKAQKKAFVRKAINTK